MIVFIVVALFGWDIIKDMERLQNEAIIIEQNNSKSHALHAIEIAVTDSVGTVREFLITGDYRLVQQFYAAHEQLIASMMMYEHKHQGNGLPTLIASAMQMKATAAEVFALPFAVGNMEGPILLQEIKGDMQKAIAQLSAQHHALDYQVSGAMQMVKGLRMDMRSDALALLFVLFFTLLLLTYFIYSQIVIPLIKMKKTAQKIGQGEFSSECMITSDDEIGDLARAFNAMALALQERDVQLGRTRALAAYHEKMNALGFISTGIAHEIGNPLAAVSISLQLAERKLSSNDQHAVKKQLRIALAETERIESIIHLMLNFSRQDHDTQRHFFDSAKVIDDAIKLAKISPKHPHITITKHIASDLPHAFASDGILLQVIMNLIFNAMHACQHQGDITIMAHAEQEKLVVDVRDTGHGIPVAQQQAIFSPHFTTKEKGEGTGLGLAISRELMNSIGGSLVLLEDDSIQTCFRLHVPINKAAPC